MKVREYLFKEGDFVYKKNRPEEIYLVLVELYSLLQAEDYYVLQNVYTKQRLVYNVLEVEFERVIDENKLRYLNILYNN